MVTATRANRRKNNDRADRSRKSTRDEATPARSLRSRPRLTEKGTGFQNTQERKRRKIQLSTLKKSPAPSNKLDMLSPKGPNTAKRTPDGQVEKASVSERGSEKKTAKKFLFDGSDDEDKENLRNKSVAKDHDECKDTKLDTNRTAGDTDNKDFLLRIQVITDIELITRKRSVALPKLFEGLAYSAFSFIDSNLESKVLCFNREGTIQDIDEEVRFPFTYTCAIHDDRLKLRRSTDQIRDVTQLYGGTSIIDLATQWIFMEPNTSYFDRKAWCPLPAITYYYMAKHEYTGEKNDLDRILLLNPDTANLLTFRVIDLVVHIGSHYSRVFIMNTNLLMDGSAKFKKADDDPIPCIIHCDSLSLHNTDMVAGKIRTFLNQFIKTKYGFRGIFNKNSLPVFKLQVPQQQNGWACAYHTIYHRFCLMKVLKRAGNVYYKDVVSNDALRRFSKDNFSFDESEVMTLRSDIRYLDDTMQNICRYSKKQAQSIEIDRTAHPLDGDVVDLTDVDDLPDDYKAIALSMPQNCSAKKKEIAKEKTQRKSLEGGKAIQKETIDSFAGKLRTGDRPDQEKMIKKLTVSTKRRKGEPASSLRCYKDAVFRRMLFKLTDAVGALTSMLKFRKDTTNKQVRRMRTIGLIYDPISLYPDKEGADFCQYREEPKRIAIGSAEEVDFLIKDLIDNKDKYVTENNLMEIDRLILGEERPPLRSFIKNQMKRSQSVQQKPENKEALAKTNRLESTPVIATNHCENQDLDDELANMIF